MRVSGNSARYQAGHPAGHVLAVIVVPAQHPDVHVPGEPGHGPHVAGGEIQGRGYRGVAEAVRPDMKVDLAADSLDHLVQGPAGESPAALAGVIHARKQRPVFFAAKGEPGGQGFTGRPGQGERDTLAAAFAHDRASSAGKVQVLPVQADHFGAPQAQIEE